MKELALEQHDKANETRKGLNVPAAQFQQGQECTHKRCNKKRMLSADHRQGGAAGRPRHMGNLTPHGAFAAVEASLQKQIEIAPELAITAVH